MVNLFKVPKQLEGTRLDRAVAMLLGIARTKAKSLVEAGWVKVDGQTEYRLALKLGANQMLEVDASSMLTENIIVPNGNVPVEVLYENEDLLVINKPPFHVVYPGLGKERNSVVAGVISKYPEIRDVGELRRPGIINRLDKDTSGALLIARNDEAYVALKTMLRERQITRQYIALTSKKLSSEIATINLPIGKLPNSPKFGVMAQGKNAITHYEVVTHLDDTSDLVKVTLETGRTHQIRVHFRFLNAPIYGDSIYGHKSLELKRQFLHAYHMKLTYKGREISVLAPLTGDLDEFLKTKFKVKLDLKSLL